MRLIFGLLGYAIGRREPQRVVYVSQAALDRQKQARRNGRLFVFLIVGGFLFWYFGAPHA
jgi:hypothetical protein